MGAVQRIEVPALYPGRTAWGQTRGPVVDVGYVIQPTETLPGVRVYLSERESREVLIAWGWPSPEMFAEEQELRRELTDRVEQLEAELAEKQEALEAVNVIKRYRAPAESTATGVTG